MGEEVADEDVVADVLWEFGEPVADGVVEGEGVVLFEEEDGKAGELF